MATKVEVSTLIVDLWREKIDVFGLKKRVSEAKNEVSTTILIGMVVHTVYNGTTTNGVEYLKQGINIGVFPPNLVIDDLTKLSLGRKLKCFNSSIDVIDICSTNLRHDTGKDSRLVICKSISKATFWVLENTIEVYKALYIALKDGLSAPDPDSLLNVISKSQKLLKKLICSESFQDLNFIGKLSFAEEFPSLQAQTKEIISLQLDKINTNPMYGKYESSLKELVNCITRFLNTSPAFVNYERPRGEVPCHQLFTFLQFQVLEYHFVPSTKIADILDIWLKIENFSVDQVFVDLVRFSIHNILVRTDQFEQMSFIGFLFVKLPAILSEINSKYPQQNGNTSIIMSICRQIALINFENVNSYLGCDGFQTFINRCQVKRSLDATQAEQLLMSYTAPSQVVSDDSSLLSKLFAAIKRQEEILPKLSSSIDENRDVIAQELSALITSQDHLFILIAAACTDNMKNLIQALMRINANAERCPAGSKDVHADVRADLFNNTFLILTYIGTMFGKKVFIEVTSTSDSSFFTTWKRDCTKITSRKMYSQIAMDTMLEPIPTSHNPQNNNAQWDEYCWSVGMIVKELTQAHLRRHISTDDLQKICEGFKNKKPALCVCAMTWLCSQYKTMPANERSRTVKIINLFKRPTKAVMLNTVLNKYSMPLEPDLHAAISKNKSATQEQPQSAGVVFTTILNDLCSSANGKVHFHANILKSIRKWYVDFGIPAFTQSITKLILQSGKEEDSKLHEEICICLVLLEPVKIFKELFTDVLKSSFHCPSTSRTFSDPQGLCLARCISKAFAIALIIHDIDASDTHPRPAKAIKLSTVIKSGREQLIDFYVQFLEDAILIFSIKQKNAVSTFVLNLIEQISMALALFRQPITINEEVATRLLKQLPLGTSRGTVTMLCNLATVKGQEAAAEVFFRQTAI